MRCYNKAMFRTAITGTVAMVSLAMGPVTEASAGCLNLPGFKAGAVQPISWQGKGEFRARLSSAGRGPGPLR